MKQFLSIVLRNQFNLFYRFGYTSIPKSQLVEFDGNINNETQQNIIEQFKKVTPFEYDEEYLILHLEKETTNESDFIQFEIQDIVSVYPLSQHAKISIEAKIDQRIRLENPIFETILPAIETEIEKKEIEKGISALWEICKIESPLEKYIANIGLENIFKGLEHRKHATKANSIQNGNYWEYLIAYERYDYFPNSTLGYFYDAGQVFAYSKGFKTFEGSQLHAFLQKLNSEEPKAKLRDIINFLEKEEQLKGYVTQTTTSDIKKYIVTPLYLMLRDEIRKSDDIAQTKLFKNLVYLKTFNDSFNYAVILLGAFFGFRKFYDIYYEVLNLRFYKDFKTTQMQPIKEEQQEKVDTILETDNSVKTVTEEEQPKAEQTKAEQTKAEQPKAEQPKAEQPKAEQLKEEQPKEEQTKEEQTKEEQTKAEQPKAEQPKAEQPKAEQPKAEQLKEEQPKEEQTKEEQTKEEQTKAEQPKAEQPKAEQLKEEQPKEEQQEKVDTILETDNSVKTVTEEEQLNKNNQKKNNQKKNNQKKNNQKKNNQKKKQTENKNEEIATKTIPEKEPNLDDKPEAQFVEKKVETEIEEVSNDSNTQKNDKIKDDESIIKKMIEQELEKETKIKLSEIAEMIKTKTGKKVQIGFIEKVAKQMNGIELIKIGQAKGVMRTTGNTRDLFN